MPAILAAVLWLFALLATAADYSASACRIRAAEGGGVFSLGSGVLIEEQGKLFVLTNAHVVGSARVVQVTFPSAQVQFDAPVLLKDRGADVAVIEGERAGDVPALVLGDPQGVREATVYGFGGGPFASMTAPVDYTGGGVYNPGGPPAVLLGGAVRSGDSGSPIVANRGFVIGLVWGSARGQAYGVPIGPIRAIVRHALGVSPMGGCYRLPGGGWQCPTQPAPRPIGPPQGGMTPRPQSPPQRPAEPPATPADPDCCDELAAKIADLADAAKDGYAALGSRIDGLEGRIAEAETRVGSLLAIDGRVSTIEDRFGNWAPPRAHYVLVADTTAEYWQRLRDEYNRAREAYSGLRIAPPPKWDAGQMPRLVVFENGTPLGDVGGSRPVSDALGRIARGDRPDFVTRTRG